MTLKVVTRAGSGSLCQDCREIQLLHIVLKKYHTFSKALQSPPTEWSLSWVSRAYVSSSSFKSIPYLVYPSIIMIKLIITQIPLTCPWELPICFIRAKLYIRHPFHFFFAALLQSRYHYSHFIDEETGQRFELRI